MAQRSDLPNIEKGNIYFFYRPKVEEKTPTSETDIQRFYVVLSPEKKHLYRLAVIGQKELPNPEESGHERYWGYINFVTDTAKELQIQLGPEKYRTKTRGERHLGTARPAGEGIYRIIKHNGHTHLVYALELPKKLGTVQKELNIEEQASYIITVKNPESGSPRRAGLTKNRDAEYPKVLQERFRGRRFSEIDTPDFLNYKGAQFILIASSDDLRKDLKMTLPKENETESTADIFTDLKMDLSKKPTKPLFEGEWQ